MGVAERFAFVFGSSADPSAWNTADVADKCMLLEKRFGDLGEAQLLVRLGVIEQLLGDKVPQVWATAQRLSASGSSADLVINQLAMAFAQTVREAIVKGVLDEEAYAKRLDRLPLPVAAEIKRALLDVAEASVVLPTEELVAVAVDQLGCERDDSLIVNLVERVEEELADDFGPLVWLVGDRTAHVASLCEGIVLTHVLNEPEREIGVLTVSFDLAGFGRIEELSFEGEPVEPVSVERGHLAWMGPHGWLDRFEVGTALAVRVSADGAIGLSPLTESPAVEPDLVELVRLVYDQVVEEPQLPVSGEDLIFGLLAADRATFAAARAPLSTLCEAAELELRASAVVHDPEIWANQETLGRIHRVFDQAGDKELASQVLEILELIDELEVDETTIDAARVGRALDGLADLEVLELVTDELFDDRLPRRGAETVASRLVEAAKSPAQRATARLVAAMAAESAGDWLSAEQHLELAVEADHSNVPATDRLAWYVSDRGDAARAAALWRRCPRSVTIAHELANLEPLLRPVASPLGRNDRCWCGSGRKYKHCHLDVIAAAPLPDRVGWLCRKAVGYLERVGPAARAAVIDVVDARASDSDDIETVIDDPLVMDLVLTEGGWFGRFLADRGHLLPDDEALLAASWMTVERTVYEITEATPGVGLTIRDLRSGDELTLRERTFSRAARIGMLACARAVPDGETNQFIGGIFPVVPGTEAALLDLLDDGDPLEIAAWVRDLYRAPKLRTRENEPLVECEIVVTAGDLRRLADHLDATYDSDVPGEWWTEHHDLDDTEGVIRARFHLESGRLTITTNSNERADRILGRLREAVEIVVVSDARTPVDADTIGRTARSGLPDLRNLDIGRGGALDPDAIAQIQEQMEARWCAEAVPALGGLTPRQAAVDPTRREQLERLLHSFDAMPAPAGAFTMRTERLRMLLGL